MRNILTSSAMCTLLYFGILLTVHHHGLWGGVCLGLFAGSVATRYDSRP